MNTGELNHFAKWLKANGEDLLAKYQAVQALLQHNSTQPQQKPIENDLESLETALQNTSLAELTNQQLKLLESFEVDDLIAKSGLDFVRETIRKNDFDPATAAQDFKVGAGRLGRAVARCDQLIGAFKGIDHSFVDEAEEGKVLVRIQFQNSASIGNVVDWSKWADEWAYIARGLAMPLGQAPETFEIVDSSRGSIIVTIQTIVAAAILLGVITKFVLHRMSEVLEITNAIEDLKLKKWQNAKLMEGYEEALTAAKASIVDDALAETTKHTSRDLNGEDTQVLTNAIRKILNFHDDGGELDFLPPSEPEAEESPAPTAELTQQLRVLTTEVRKEKENLDRLQMLTF